MANWAIIVGINEYPVTIGSGHLKGAVADATDFLDWALHADGGNVDPQHAFFWTYPHPVAAGLTLTQSVSAYLQNAPQWFSLEHGSAVADLGRAPPFQVIVETGLRAARNARNNGDRLYVFFAGHGVQSNAFDNQVKAQICFLTGDFRPGNRLASGVIPCEDLREILLAEGFSQVIMFLDCCRSVMTRLDQHVQPIVGAAAQGDPPWIVGAAAAPGQPAWETPIDAPRRGAFSTSLLQALRTVRGADNVLTLQGLRTQVAGTIGPLVTPREQEPQFYTPKPDSPFVLLRAAPIAALAPIHVYFDAAIMPGTPFNLVNRDSVETPIISVAGKLEIEQEAGQAYSIENADHSIVIPFDHHGPAPTQVNVP